MRARTVKISESYLRSLADAIDVVLTSPPLGMSSKEAVSNIAKGLRSTVEVLCTEQHKRPHGN